MEEGVGVGVGVEVGLGVGVDVAVGVGEGVGLGVGGVEGRSSSAVYPSRRLLAPTYCMSWT